jgi:hypothetical protein
VELFSLVWAWSIVDSFSRLVYSGVGFGSSVLYYHYGLLSNINYKKLLLDKSLPFKKEVRMVLVYGISKG